MELIQSRVDIRSIIKNSGNLDVIKNVFLKDYQIKLIPHLNRDDTEESEKAKDLTNQEAIDILTRRNQSTDIPEAQKTVDHFIMQHLDEDFYNQHRPDDGYNIDQFRGYPRNRNVGGRGETPQLAANNMFRPRGDGYHQTPGHNQFVPNVNQNLMR